MDEIRLAMDENGVFHEYEEPYMTIECQTEEDFEYIKAAVEFYKRNRWFPISEPPKEEGWYHIAIRDKKTGRIRVTNDLYAIEIAERFGHSHGFCKEKAWPERDEITHWCRYPEPPKEDKP